MCVCVCVCVFVCECVIADLQSSTVLAVAVASPLPSLPRAVLRFLLSLAVSPASEQEQAPFACGENASKWSAPDLVFSDSSSDAIPAHQLHRLQKSTNNKKHTNTIYVNTLIPRQCIRALRMRQKSLLLYTVCDVLHCTVP